VSRAFHETAAIEPPVAPSLVLARMKGVPARRWIVKLRPLVLALPAAFALVSSAATAAPDVPAFDHIFVILMENHSYTSIVGSSDAPYINSLISQYAVAGNYFAVTHPSLPNYIALTGGDTFGITSDCTTCFINVPNIAADRVEPSGRSWKSYMDGMPSACFGGNSGSYAQKHNPLYYFNDIRTVPAECNRIVPYTNLAADLGSVSTTPSYAFISPNQCNDMHDSCAPTNNPIRQGDTWLSANLPVILNSPAFITQNMLVVVVWDEDDSAGANQVPAIFIAKSVVPGFVSHVRYDHYSLLRTIESSWGLAALTTNDTNATAMSDLFAPIPSAPAGQPWSDIVLFGLLGASGVIAVRARRRSANA
jgi:acid phosphatase